MKNINLRLRSKGINWSAENFKMPHTTLRSCHLSPRYGHVISGYPFWQSSFDHNMDVSYQVKHRLQASTLARKFDISHWFPSRADGRTDGHMITQISWMDRLPHFLRYGAPSARVRFVHVWSSTKICVNLDIGQLSKKVQSSPDNLLTNKCHITVLQAKVYISLRWHVFLKFSANQLLVFNNHWSQAQVHYFRRNPVCSLSAYGKVELLQKDSSFGLG